MKAAPVIRRSQSLKTYNTFGVDARADLMVEITQVDHLSWVFANYRDHPYLLLGGGSNVLLTRPVEPLVLLMRMKGIAETGRDESHVWIKAMAGESWHEFVLYCLEQGYCGLENLALIPGSVGAAPIQNIGAYGVEVCDYIHEVEYLDTRTRQVHVLKGSECGFDYRDSIFKQSLKSVAVILSVTFRLGLQFVPVVRYKALNEYLSASKSDELSQSDVFNAVIAIRRSKLPDPELLGNAGSFFKNPVVDADLGERLSQLYPDIPIYRVDGFRVKLAAGWLIENAGWKGYRRGDAGIHSQQALVVVNYGNAKGSEILGLAEEVRQDIKERFGVWLDLEVNIR